MKIDDNRIFGLDLLRALAVLFVVYTHGYGLIASHVNHQAYNLPAYDGVTLFFVLSGFLIGKILLQTVVKDAFNGRMLIEFWYRRWFRTLPNYVIVLTFVWISFYFQGRGQPGGMLSYFFFSQNLAWPHPPLFSEAWSLAVEEWFYLCIPIPLYLSTKLRNVDRRRLMLGLTILVILSVTAFRIYRSYYFGYATPAEWDQAMRKQVITRIDSIMLGVLGAYVSVYHLRAWAKAPVHLFIAGVVLLLVDKVYGEISLNMFYLNYLSLSVSAVGTLLMLPALSSWRRPGDLLTRVVTFVSLISYSMYLLNLAPVQLVIMPFFWKVCASCGQNSYVQYVTYWCITICGSYLLYRFFERPMTALRDKWPAFPRTVFEEVLESSRGSSAA